MAVCEIAGTVGSAVGYVSTHAAAGESWRFVVHECEAGAGGCHGGGFVSIR